MTMSAWCGFRRVTFLILAVVVINADAIGQQQFEQPIGAPRDFSDRQIGQRQPMASINDVLRWRRDQLALQAPTNAPRIDGISESNSPEIDSDAAIDPYYRSGGDGEIRDDLTSEELVILLRAMQRQMNTNTEMIGNNTKLVQTLKQSLDEATTQLEQNMANQRDILLRQQQVIDSVTSEDADGQRRLELSGNMALGDEFVREIDSALKQSQPTEGALIIRNPLEQDQVIVVNDQPYTVNAGVSARIIVPLGNVVTRIPGGGTYSWFLGLPQPEVFIRLVDEMSGR